jgi:acyl-CoA thioesterase FadM
MVVLPEPLSPITKLVFPVSKTKEISQNKVSMSFEYYKNNELIAKGEQQIACMIKENNEIIAHPLPESLSLALKEYS